MGVEWVRSKISCLEAQTLIQYALLSILLTSHDHHLSDLNLNLFFGNLHISDFRKKSWLFPNQRGGGPAGGGKIQCFPKIRNGGLHLNKSWNNCLLINLIHQHHSHHVGFRFWYDNLSVEFDVLVRFVYAGVISIGCQS